MQVTCSLGRSWQPPQLRCERGWDRPDQGQRVNKINILHEYAHMSHRSAQCQCYTDRGAGARSVSTCLAVSGRASTLSAGRSGCPAPPLSLCSVDDGVWKVGSGDDRPSSSAEKYSSENSLCSELREAMARRRPPGWSAEGSPTEASECREPRRPAAAGAQTTEEGRVCSERVDWPARAVGRTSRESDRCRVAESTWRRGAELGQPASTPRRRRRPHTCSISASSKLPWVNRIAQSDHAAKRKTHRIIMPNKARAHASNIGLRVMPDLRMAWRTVPPVTRVI